MKYQVIATSEGNQTVCILGENGKNFTSNKSRAERIKGLCEGFGLTAKIIAVRTCKCGKFVEDKR